MTVFLDACVLFPPLVRGLVSGAAEAGLFTPRWSARVLEEWRRAVRAKQGAEAALLAEDAAMALQARFPGGLTQAEPDLEETLILPDPADAHVLAAAIAGGAGVLLTFNLRDFPRRALAWHGIEARHPDGFFWELLSLEEAAMAQVTSCVLQQAGVSPDRARAVLKRARLSRFGKAWESLHSP